MNTYIVCPERKDKRIPIKSCLSKCDTREKCKEFQAHEKPNLPEVVEGEGEKELYERALYISRSVNGSFWDLGEVFHKICEGRHWGECSGWEEFKENSELVKQIGVKGRVIEYLRAIFVTYTKLGFTREDVAPVGWTKLRTLIPVAKTKPEAIEWIKKAGEKGMTDEKLSVEVRTHTGRLDKDSVEETETLTFKIFPGQKDNILKALSLARDITGSDARSNLLETLAIEFRTTYENAASKETALNGMLSRIEALFNVKIEATDLATGQMVRG